MEESPYLENARRLIDHVKGRMISVEERRELAIELAALMLNEARRVQTTSEHRILAQLDHMMEDPVGKVFTTSMTDECFRSKLPARVADQMIHLINKFGIPKYLSYFRQLQLFVFKCLGQSIPQVFVPLARRMLRKETSRVILPGEKRPLSRYMEKRKKAGVRVNLNHLGEAILGEEEAKRRLEIYLEDLARPEVEYISIKISTICSQINLLSWEETLEVLEPRLKKLYRQAMTHFYVRANGKRVPKFVNLDMEEYRDLHLTVELFRRVLDDPEFYQHSAGIVLQSYLPDSYLLQQELTVWAMKRVANGGAPIKIRLVKGANLAMEQVEASLKGWAQAPYTNKVDVDANFKRMLAYACQPDHAKAARVGVGSHNLFDIAYAMLLRSETGMEGFVEFEMLEGMADHMRRVVQTLSGDILLYCPAATEKEFVHAVAYLVRRLDENTAPENFLRHIFGLYPDTEEWQSQANHFSLACHAANAVSKSPRRTQNRFHEAASVSIELPFQNEPDTDWTLPQNRKWIQQILQGWKKKEIAPIPLVVAGREIPPDDHCFGEGVDPSVPGKVLYHYALADQEQAEKALQCASVAGAKWDEVSLEERCSILSELASLLRQNRGELICAMVADAGKIVEEADVEVSEAIDFVEYYMRQAKFWHEMSDLQWAPKGTVLVAPPWNFPCAIPLGGVVAALVTGNSVIFKPARETVLVAWLLANLCWDAGISKETLQFILCEDEPVGSRLVQDSRVDTVILTGATSTAELMLRMRPGLDLMAETGGKNAMIVTGMSDRDLAIKDTVRSAFGHAGQKCSACSLLILEKEVYEDRKFLQTLKDAAQSLQTGSAWDLSTKINPLINEPSDKLLEGLTTLEEGESWLLKPRQDPKNPRLWSPGIKLGVKQGGKAYRTEYFGPVLSVMCADDLEHAIRLVNGTGYGLTSGLHSLDEREEKLWREKVIAGNLYVNRTITGAIVQRQPFGGCKKSGFGKGAKAGGPNYVSQLMRAEQKALPSHRTALDSSINVLGLFIQKFELSSEKMEIWEASVQSYAYHYKHDFSTAADPSKIVGEDNLFQYVPHEKVVLRVQPQDELIDTMRIIAAAAICRTHLEVSGDSKTVLQISKGDWVNLSSKVHVISESESNFIDRVLKGEVERIRLISAPSSSLSQALSEACCHVHLSQVVANGRLELLHYLREVSYSCDYHRYGNLGMREHEERAPIL
ncbi:bifunctional proline dehydrogenase/L-glutamate gamma-semialdehyde dehydrogenase [Waddlia chondrophila]|uniref:L-glutamate gamma-semialdehyde dehydrogenase n=1 Tax=Waddlia chondrophila (strain ATCC VR-1470 / WSU 86-1044) TaxID=716544 RepID=D6YSZ0_WADCW|nr:proline dehydrogenase family protein [Waddlia chondrophila]ADI39185.1 putative proline dehydrogenase/delta-1-pyrroline- 5-carboxylate dehydrogenase [Waddlia chondrophila WSU 86-1044]